MAETDKKTIIQKAKDFVKKNKVPILIVAVIAAYAVYQKKGGVKPAPSGHLRYYYF